MHVHGQCHCGAIRFEAEVDPESVVICHCTDCQTLSGTAFRVVAPAKAGSFRLLSGRPKEYVKTAESGNKRVQAFCADCGTPIYAAAQGDTDVVTLRVGAITQRAQLAPKRQCWHRSAIDWLSDLPDLPSIPTQAQR